MPYKDTVQTANELGLSANQNFKRIVSELQSIHENEDDHARRLILDDSIRLIKQQNSEIHTLLREKQC